MYHVGSSYDYRDPSYKEVLLLDESAVKEGDPHASSRMRTL